MVTSMGLMGASIEAVPSVAGNPASDGTVRRRAYQRALTTLRHRYSSLGILAGANHFSDLWARDFCFASWGALSVGDTTVVTQGLDTLMGFMTPDGQIPLRVGQPIFLLKYIGINANPPRPRYIDDKGFSVSVDNNSLAVGLCHAYVSHTHDMAFLSRSFDTIYRMALWNDTQDRDGDGLMEEGPYAGWADSLKKRGKVYYTNVLHVHACGCVADLARRLGHAETGALTARYERAKNRLREVFWTGRYGVDWVDGQHVQSTFSTEANLLAIITHLLSREEAQSVFDVMAERGMTGHPVVPTVSPAYDAKHVYPPFRLIGLSDYHNGLSWIWVGCLEVVARWEMGDQAGATAALDRLATLIECHQGVYEVYDKGQPVRRLFYRSEEWFAWSSGLFVWACQKTGLHGESA